MSCVSAELARRGHDVLVLTTKLLSEVPLRIDPALPDEEEADGVRVVRTPIRRTGIGAWGYGFWIPNVAERVAALAPDIVHLHGYGYLAGDTVVRRRGPWRLVLTSHGFVSGRGAFRPLKRLYDATQGRRTVASVDAAVALTPRDERIFRALGARRCVVIPNGVELERFATPRSDQALLTRLGVEPRRYVISVARLERIKGQDLLIRAFARLRLEHPAPRLVLVGEGSEEARLRKLARRLGLDVAFAGRPTDTELVALMRDALALAHTPRDEPFGIVVLEAMAASVPVLATAVGGLPFVIGDAALLVPPHVGAIADGLARVLGDPFLGEQLVQNGAVRARAFSWGAAVDALEALYRELAP